MLPGMELLSCPDLAVPREVMHHVVHVESSYNPYAIGVVGGRLVRQPRTLAEAVSTARMLEQRGYNFSLGLAQVNRYNLVKYGLDSYVRAFQPCANLQAGSRILAECYRRSGDWGKSFSCYYSGDFKTGYRHGYVQKVYASMRQGRRADALAAGAAPIPVLERVQRRAVTARIDLEPAPTAATPGLVERRGGMVATPPPAVAAPLPAVAAAPATAAGAATAPASAMALSVPVSLPMQAPPSPQASGLPANGAAVVVAATRHGASPAQPSSRTEQGGDGAFVF